MVELGEIAPGIDVVTVHAAQRRGAGFGGGNAKLSPVWILVASLARKAAELEGHGSGPFRALHVAIHASYRCMRARQGEARAGVRGQGVFGRAEPVHRVAVFARGVGELGLVSI